MAQAGRDHRRDDVAGRLALALAGQLLRDCRRLRLSRGHLRARTANRRPRADRALRTVLCRLVRPRAAVDPAYCARRRTRAGLCADRGVDLLAAVLARLSLVVAHPSAFSCAALTHARE